MLIIDSHCHLDFKDFELDIDNVIDKASANSVRGIQTICTRLDEFEKVWKIADANLGVWCSVGVHPHNVKYEDAHTVKDITNFAKRKHVIGIGETGLDFYYDHSPRDLQVSSFRMHLKAAKEMDLPVIVHTRDAEEDTCKILKEECSDGTLKGVIHCFSGSDYLASSALELGFYISFSGIITFKNASNIRNICAQTPIDRILVETDSPYLAPVPHRGKRNEPAFVTETLKLVAELKGLSNNEMAAITTDNFFKLFTNAKIEDTE